MDNQTIINTAIGLIGALGAIILKSVREDMKDLRNGNTKTADRVHEIETLIAGQYIKRGESQQITDTIFNKLDSMSQNILARFDALSDKLDGKLDKRDYDEIDRRRP